MSDLNQAVKHITCFTERFGILFSENAREHKPARPPTSPVPGSLSVASRYCKQTDGSHCVDCHHSSVYQSAMPVIKYIIWLGYDLCRLYNNTNITVHGFIVRTMLPAPMFPRNSVSIWGILKKCIGLVSSTIMF